MDEDHGKIDMCMMVMERSRILFHAPTDMHCIEGPIQETHKISFNKINKTATGLHPPKKITLASAARARAPPLLRSNTLNFMALQIRVGA